MLLNDAEIRGLAEAGMIAPYTPTKVRKVLMQGPRELPVISYGSSSYGYDLRLSLQDFRIFRHVPGLIVDPKAFDARCLAPAPLYTDETGSYFILPAHTYALGVVEEYLKLPPDVTAFFIGKSTFARCGIIVNTTPGEAGWEGYLTLEISNSSGADCKIYAKEGICQALFFRGNPCETPYGDGKYQNQAAGVTLARV
jgi:dCTP deaminase